MMKFSHLELFIGSWIFTIIGLAAKVVPLLQVVSLSLAIYLTILGIIKIQKEQK